jgi:predicted Zn-dependent peptidase
MLRTGFVSAVAALLVGLGLGTQAVAIDLATFEKSITVDELDNGLTFVVYERPKAPVVSFFTHVDVGSAQEVPGITGLAHMFEHMAFKGTSRIGTSNYAAEKKALERVDRAYAALAAERHELDGPDPDDVSRLEAELKQAQDEADKHIVKNEFGEIVDRAGGVGLNAFTNADTTGYMFSLPANKVELWAYLESERFLDPVFREYYKERDVVQEERRMRTESQPIGRLVEQFLTTAFVAHPYGQPTVGYMSDLKSITREDADEFFRTHYVPDNITIAIVGDVEADEVLPIVRKYFGRLEKRPPAPPLRTVEPTPIAEKTVRVPDPSQPVYIEGYMRPSARHADDAVYDAMADILSTGRDSRLYERLVRDEKVAAFAGAFNGFPGTKYPHMMLFFGMAAPGHSNEEIQASIRDEIERLKTEPVGGEELQKVKTRAKAGLVRSLASNSGLASNLATYQAQYGDWRELFRNVERIEKVTAEDIMRVAKDTFVPTNRTVGMIVTEEATATGGAGSSASD